MTKMVCYHCGDKIDAQEQIFELNGAVYCPKCVKVKTIKAYEIKGVASELLEYDVVEYKNKECYKKDLKDKKNHYIELLKKIKNKKTKDENDEIVLYYFENELEKVDSILKSES